MKRKTYRPFILLALVLFGCLNLPSSFVEPFRSGVVHLAGPVWKRLSFPVEDKGEELVKKLEAEKALLERQNHHLKKRLASEQETPQSLFAQVIYREPTSWSSTLWIDVGEKDNEALGSTVVAKNSPVVSGKALVGVVEIVRKKQSRVRLLTDSSLVVSVRVVRGDLHKQNILRHVKELSLELSLNQDAFLQMEEEKILFEKLGILKAKLEEEGENKYLAKGELYGTSAPLWRSRSPTLRGVGFNYDFEDAQGPARELRTGKPYVSLFHDQGVSLIREGDLLVTTGMEGVFPPDIPVAIVTKVDPLKEGAASYSLEAKLCASQLEDLSHLTILPPLNLEEPF